MLLKSFQIINSLSVICRIAERRINLAHKANQFHYKPWSINFVSIHSGILTGSYDYELKFLQTQESFKLILEAYLKTVYTFLLGDYCIQDWVTYLIYNVYMYIMNLLSIYVSRYSLYYIRLYLLYTYFPFIALTYKIIEACQFWAAKTIKV